MNKVKRASWKVSVTARLLLSALFFITPLISADLKTAQTLTKELSDEDFKIREAALTSLWKMGEESLPSLQEAAASKDPEAARRAKELILYITLGILHDSPREIIDLVLQYAEAVPRNQYSILTTLSKQGYWRQAVKLIKRQDIKETSPSVIKLANALVSHHTRQSILSGDLAQAEEILMMAPDSKDSYMLQAWFYKYLKGNEFAQQLAKYKAMEGEEAAQRRMALHSINGDTSAALIEAKDTQDTEMTNILYVLEGNAEPWLSEQLNNQIISPGITAAWELQLLRLKGKHQEAQELADSILREAHDNLKGINHTQDSDLSIAALAANGYKAHALEILELTHPESASLYHSNTDNPIASLASLGIPKDAVAPYTEWIAAVTQQALANTDYYDRLLSLASFHHYHGEPEHIISVMSPIMTQLEKDNSADWYKIIADLTKSNMGEQALLFLKKRGNENNEIERGLAYFLIKEESAQLTDWQQLMWEFLKNRHPNDLSESLHEIALLSGSISDLEGETTKLHQELAIAFSDLPAHETLPLSNALYNFAEARNDFILSYQMAEERAKKDPAWKNVIQIFNESLQKWDKAEAYLEQRAKADPSRYDYRTDWYICLRKLGKHQQAAEVYREILLFTMMESNALNTIAFKLYEVGYDEEALALWQIVLLDKPSLTKESEAAIIVLTPRLQHLYHTNQWQKAAAIKEVYLQLNMRGSVTHEEFSSHLSTRFHAEFCHGMALYQQGNRKEAITTLNNSRKIASNGSLADEFFPAIRKIDLGDHYKQWFEESYQQLKSVCELYPNAHNTQNTTAWLASRSVMRLDEGLAHAKKATSLRPSQPAYLDTMAEIWFAKGNRPKAIEWSEKATTGAISHAQGLPKSSASVFWTFKMFNKQQDHFRNDPLPKPYKAGKK